MKDEGKRRPSKSEQRASSSKKLEHCFGFIHQRSSVILSLLLVLLPLVALLGPALVRDESFVYRDAAHFYYPLFEWTAREWGEGRIPLWNPQENCGLPVVGDATSSVFYPGKLVFALPWLSFALKFKLYLVGHAALAAIGAFLAARRWRASLPAAAACAISYACGGSVLFQIYNVVFLVGAAWLPFAFLSAERMLAERNWKQALLFGTTLALMTLGGDPQTAYHAGMLAVLYAIFVGWSAQKSHPTAPWLARVVSSRMVLLALAATTGGLLAAIQILPALEWSRLSERAAFDQPRSIYESWKFMTQERERSLERPLPITNPMGEVVAGLTGPARSGTHHEAIYDFSQSPWRLAELLWPNFAGRPFPENRRWLDTLPAEGRSWTPSIYMGLLPLLLGLGSLRLWGATPREHWLSWALLLSTIAALGWYGIGWLVLEIHSSLSGAGANSLPIGAPTGGLYWFFVVFLPGYAQFRYPAKWLVPAALALSLLAARGWDRAFGVEVGSDTNLKRERRESSSRADAKRKGVGPWRLALLACGAISALGVVLALVLRTSWANLFLNAPVDDYFGELDLAGSWNDLALAFAHTTLLCGVFAGVVRDATKRSGIRENSDSKWAGILTNSATRFDLRIVRSWVAAAITAVEIVVAQRTLIVTAPDKIWTTPSPLAAHISQHSGQDAPAGVRVFRALPERWLPPVVAGQGATNRQVANLRWERETLFPRYSLLERQASISLVESSTTLTLRDQARFMHVARVNGESRPDEQREPHDGALRLLACEYLILPQGFSYRGHEQISELENAVLWHNPHAWPRAWVTHLVAPGEPPVPGDADSLEWSNTRVTERSRMVAGPLAIVEPPAAIPGEMLLGKRDPRSPYTGPLYGECSLIRDDRQQVEIEATLEQPGLLVLADLHYPGWVAESRNEATGETRQLEIVRTNRILRGVFLSAGRHHITFAYRPASFFGGAAVSVIAWSVLLIGGAVALANGRRTLVASRSTNERSIA